MGFNLDQTTTPNLLVAILVMLLASGCVPLKSKQESFPRMYGSEKPKSIVVVPAINKSTAADASDYLNVTVTKPFADSGYYVIPISVVADIFRDEGIVDGAQIKGLPPKTFLDTFGADAVLFITINSWDKNFYVISSNVTVDMEYLLLSTHTSEVLWSYQGRLVVQPSQSSTSGNPLADVIANAIAAAITAALTRYIDVAGQVHSQVLVTMPFGEYHPKSGKDGELKVVAEKKQSAAVEE